MPKNKKQKIVLFLLFFMLFSCTKIIEIDFPKQEPKLVVNSLFTNDSIFKINVSQTTNFNQSSVKFIPDAEIILSEENNDIVSQFEYTGNGIYKSINGYKPVLNKKYKIEINHPELGQIKSSNKIPVSPNILLINKRDSVFTDEDGYYMSEADITIQDNPNEKNWYEFELTAYYYDDYSGIPGYGDSNQIDTVPHKRTLYITSNDIVLTNEGLTDYYPSYYPLSDTLFNGLTYTLKLQYLPPQDILGINDAEYNLAKNYKLTVTVRSVTEEYYKYRKKLIIHLENQSGDVWDGMGNPVQMYSNIEGGYGIFAGYSSFTDTIP